MSESMIARGSRSRVVLVLVAALAACVALCLALPARALALEIAAAGDAGALSAQDVTMQAQKAKVHKVCNAKQWHAISKYKGGTFKIMKNITLPSESYYLNIRKSKKYVIDLNGHKVKTAYTGVPLRTVCPLNVAGGTVILKNSKKKGMLYSTETAAVTIQGYGKFYLKNATIVNNATEFRSDITSGIMVYGKGKCYLQGKSRIQSIGNGVALFEKSRLYATGNPWVRAGANTYEGQFMHYGCGINIASRDARVSLKGGSYGTKASPDAALDSPVGTFMYAQSANYPILDQFGYALEKAVGKKYKVVDAKGHVVKVRGSNLSDYYDGVNAPSWEELLAELGYKPEQRYTTYETDKAGYYSVYIKKKK